MRRSNWKSKFLIILAFIIGAIAGVAVAIFIPGEYAQYRGLCTFGTIAIVAGAIVFIAVRILRIGED